MTKIVEFDESIAKASLDNFAKAMEAKVRAHADDRGGWSDKPPSYFISRILNKFVKITEDVEEMNWEQCCNRLVDLANYSWMFYDRVGGTSEVRNVE